MSFLFIVLKQLRKDVKSLFYFKNTYNFKSFISMAAGCVLTCRILFIALRDIIYLVRVI